MIERFRDFLQQAVDHFDEDDEEALPEEDAFVEETKRTRHSFIEIEGKDVAPIAALYRRLHHTQRELGGLVADYERQYRELVETLTQLQEELRTKTEALRAQYGVDGDEDYELTLPSKTGGIGLFSRLPDSEGD